MKIIAIKCKKCGAIVYSRARHDFRWCACGEDGCFIDGGQEDYVRVGGDPIMTEEVDLDLPVTLEELYDDWNFHRDRFGLIEKNGLQRAIDKVKKTTATGAKRRGKNKKKR